MTAELELLVLPGTIRCDHGGKVKIQASQRWVTVAGDPVLREDDPQSRDIDWCPNRGANIKYCGKTLKVEVGYSEFVRIGGRPVVLANLAGKTNGTPPQSVHYRVRDPGQRFVRVGS